MREIFTSGTVGGALGNQCFYPEIFTFALTHPNTLDRPSLPLCLPHFYSNAGLVEGRDIPPQRRDFALGWISLYRLLTQGSI